MTTDYFLLAGAQRCGTTLLYRLLEQHPEIDMAYPVRPEPKFFFRPDVASLTFRDYRALFRGKRDAHVLGEKSTSYMERCEIAETVQSLLGLAKIVIILRDPVERAISNYRFSFDNGVETASLEEAIFTENTRREHYDRTKFSVSPFAYAARGHYHQFIERWEAAVGRERIHILVLERLLIDPAVIQALFRWLDVKPSIEPPMPCKLSNESITTAHVPLVVRRHLTEEFAYSNRRLRERYGVDVSLWQSSRTGT